MTAVKKIQYITTIDRLIAQGGKRLAHYEQCLVKARARKDRADTFVYLTMVARETNSLARLAAERHELIHKQEPRT